MDTIDVEGIVSRVMREYLNKTQTRFSVPQSVYSEDLWEYIMYLRRSTMASTPLHDANGQSLWYCKDGINTHYLELLNKSAAADILEGLSPKYAAEVLSDMLLDEACSSAMLEGEHAPRERIRELIRQHQPASNRSEQLALNHYNALQSIIGSIQQPIDERLLLKLKAIISQDLYNEDTPDGYRKAASPRTALPEHRCAAPEEIASGVRELFSYVNAPDSLSPFVKAAIFHYYLLYLSPFTQGNGCIARTLVYKFFIKNGYGFFKVYSLSSALQRNVGRYITALQDVQSSGGDLTYFINFMLEMMYLSVSEPSNLFFAPARYEYITESLKELKVWITPRLQKVIKFYIKKKDQEITLEEHKKRYKLSYETARQDFIFLEELGIARKEERGRKFVYTIVNDTQTLKRYLNNQRKH